MGKKVSKVASRALLGFMGFVVPVIVAACYGVPYRFTKAGKVVDSVTKVGIGGIRVSCVNDGTVNDATVTAEDGTFAIWYDTPCEELRAEDPDGTENGEYTEQVVPFCEECPEMVIEMAEVPLVP
ncbi:MAG: hypothetical protein AUK47_10965 [Deltaproteobacteria bacterium CG2_30_63_29]|nr:MAG: hypothetical protein AUK47_10965 [Deltaproteobacteria bacterium CG2_30_63_29]PIV98179.1 MAG: hypothetical protein COW42_16175 [Deltaproteobacteria bacterium CG17_big_fil_post_rev_8_21_14_2_50_63_7]PJB34569.1 MAG: hypothetical protein CO108_28010 [Deltaproteobacteria bacterium CG_4_9_14_3_um_filter_63_12]